MNRKHRRTLEAIFKNPVQSNVIWKDIESFLCHLKAEITEGKGFRVGLVLNESTTFCIVRLIYVGESHKPKSATVIWINRR